MLNQPQTQSSSILLIDHPTRDPPTTRLRSIQLDEKIIETSFDTYEVPKFHKYSLQNSCNNLLCFANQATLTKEEDDTGPCLLDITTNNLITLPKPRKPSPLRSYTSYYGLGYDNKIKNYKTVRIVIFFRKDTLHNNIYFVEVNTLGESSWRLGTKMNTPSGSVFGKPISIHGALAWADFPQTDAAFSSQRYVNVFSIEEEKFSKVGLPPGLKTGHLVGINGQLCAVDLSSNLIILIWVLRDLDGNWETLCTIRMRATSGERDHRRTRVMGGLENGELLLKSYESYFIYDRKTEELACINLPIETDGETEVHCCNGWECKLGLEEYLCLRDESEAKKNGSEELAGSSAPRTLDMDKTDGWEWIELEEE